MDSIVINKKVKELFTNMEYGKVEENMQHVETWLKKLNETSKKGQSIDIFQYSKENELLVAIPIKCAKEIVEDPAAMLIWHNINKFKRSCILNRLSQEIRNNSKLIEEAEILSRGILRQETKQAVDFMASAFSYYSNMATLQLTDNPCGFALISLSDDCSLITLSLALASVLTAGYVVILQSTSKISMVCHLLVEISSSVGMPNGAINLISEHESLWENKNIAVWIELAKKVNKRTSLPVTTKFLSICNGKIPFIVFNNADVDTACEALTKAAWSFQGMCPWSADKVFVQEDIFEKFVEKLKKTMSRIKMGNANDKLVDFSYPIKPNSVQKLENYVTEAKQRGIKVVQCKEGNGDANFAPTLFIGGNCIDSSSFLENDGIPCITATAFRTISEAVNLANNSPQGFAASIWTENANLANEVAQKLKVGTVWVNDHGYFSPDQSFCPQKCSGIGYFGGRENCIIGNWRINNETTTTIKDDGDLVLDSRAVFASAKKGFESWNKIKIADRVQQLKKFAEKLTKCQASLEFKSLWKNAIFSEISRPQLFVPNVPMSTGKSLTVFQEAIGAILIDCLNLGNSMVAATIIDALLQGNSVIVRCKDVSKESIAFLQLFDSIIPNVFNVIKNDGTALEINVKDVQGYFNYLKENCNTKKSVAVADSCVSKMKLVWTI